VPIWSPGVQLRCFWAHVDASGETSLFLAVQTAYCHFFARLRRAAPSICPLHTHPNPRAPAYLNRPSPVSTSSRRSMAAARCPGLRLARATLRKQQGATFASWAPRTAGIEECSPPASGLFVGLPLLVPRLGVGSCLLCLGLAWCRSSGWASSWSWSAVKCEVS
jgi:hypothetical protein